MEAFSETLYKGYSQQLEITEVLFEQRTEHQHMIIFQNPCFGRVLALDGIVQTTEADEFIYHEMMAHVPLFAHGQATKVLIIGGGDGGMLREVARHQNVEQVVQVEIDQAVIEMSERFLPQHSQGAFQDSRVEIVIADGLQFVQETPLRFDVIISDSTDPVGPGETLFSKGFYANCHRCLKPGGILATQNGVCYMQLQEVRNTYQRLRSIFADTTFYGASVPTYVGGIMTFAWGSNDKAHRQVTLTTLEKRFQDAQLPTRYYNPVIHQGAFALPQYVVQAMQEVAS
jgi:spermidine synthase